MLISIITKAIKKFWNELPTDENDERLRPQEKKVSNMVAIELNADLVDCKYDGIRIAGGTYYVCKVEKDGKIADFRYLYSNNQIHKLLS